jgi:hypothetical protein
MPSRDKRSNWGVAIGAATKARAFALGVRRRKPDAVADLIK